MSESYRRTNEPRPLEVEGSTAGASGGGDHVHLDLPDPIFEHLKNILTWAALWDIERNAEKNQAVYDQVLPYFGLTDKK